MAVKYVPGIRRQELSSHSALGPMTGFRCQSGHVVFSRVSMGTCTICGAGIVTQVSNTPVQAEESVIKIEANSTKKGKVKAKRKARPTTARKRKKKDDESGTSTEER